MEKLNAIIKHYGIKGMQWGVRRKRGSSGRVSSDHKKTRSLLKTKKTEQLSNEQLKKLNSRLEMERKYNQLNPTATANGKRVVGRVLNQYSNLAVSAVAGAAITLTVGRAIEKVK